jgi:ATP-dependent Zn protease
MSEEARQEGGGEYIEMTANMIDKEIRHIIDEQYDRALEILEAKRELLNQTAEKLLENEIIEGEALRELEKAVSKQSESYDDSDATENRQPLAA